MTDIKSTIQFIEQGKRIKAGKERTTGVFSNNEAEFLFEDVDGDCISYYEWKDELYGKISNFLNDIDIEDNNFGRRDDCTILTGEVFDLIESGEFLTFETYGGETYLIGFKRIKKPEDGGDFYYWFDNLGYGLAVDENAEYTAIVGEVNCQVIKSKWGIDGNMCSPCYPNQGEPSNKGDVKLYSLPPDVLGDEHPRKKDVYMLEDKDDQIS